MDDESEQARAIAQQMVDDMRDRIYAALLTEGVIVKGVIDFATLTHIPETLQIVDLLADPDPLVRHACATGLFGAAIDQILGIVKAHSEKTGTGYMVLLRALAAQ